MRLDELLQRFLCHLILIVGLSACYRSEDGSIVASDAGEVDESQDAGADLASDTDRDMTGDADRLILNANLDLLTPSRSREICEQAISRTDICMEYAIQTETVEECRAYEQACRQEKDSMNRYTPCENVTYGDQGECSITAQQYFDCIDSMEAVRSCKSAGKVLITPEPCWDVVGKCELLADDFGRKPKEIPSCQAAGETRGDPIHDRNIYGADRCFPTPTRFVVLGDSVSKCFNATGGMDDCDCSWKNAAGYLRDNYAPNLILEGCYPDRHIIRGNIKDVAQDARMVAGGPGYILVWISAIGWDLMQIEAEEGGFQAAVQNAIPGWLVYWQKLFDYFNDASIFPDGATFLLNTIYSPTDQCPESDKETFFTTLTMDQELGIQYANDQVLLNFARQRADTVAVDVYPDVLGHGHNYDVSTCPHYSPDNEFWFSDDKHLNAIGCRHVAEQWKRAIDRMYGENCR